MSLSVYLDTTIFSYLFDERESLKTYTNISAGLSVREIITPLELFSEDEL